MYVLYIILACLLGIGILGKTVLNGCEGIHDCLVFIGCIACFNRLGKRVVTFLHNIAFSSLLFCRKLHRYIDSFCKRFHTVCEYFGCFGFCFGRFFGWFAPSPGIRRRAL